MAKRNKRVRAREAALIVVPKVHYPLLDGLRGIAILLILMHHLRHALALDYLFSHPTPIFQWVYLNALEHCGIDLSGFFVWLQETIHRFKGILGLQMFFVLSGFLITRMLLKDGLARVDILRFFFRRFLKIYPSYFVLVAVSFGLYYFLAFPDIDEFIASIIRYLFFLQNYFPRNQLLEHTWSLVVMEQFYFLCPIVMWFVIRLVRTAEERRALLIGLCSLAMIAGPAVRLYCLSTGHNLIDWPISAPRFWRTTIYHFDSLVFGALLALLEPHIIKLKEFKPLLWGSWVVGAASYYFLFFVADWSYYWGPWYMYSWGYLSSGVLIICSLCGVALLSRLKILQWIGIYSYGIYLWHYIVVSVLSHFGVGKISVTVLTVVCLISSIAIGFLSTKIIERYFLSVRAKWFPG